YISRVQTKRCKTNHVRINHVACYNRQHHHHRLRRVRSRQLRRRRADAQELRGEVRGLTTTSRTTSSSTTRTPWTPCPRGSSFSRSPHDRFWSSYISSFLMRNHTAWYSCGVCGGWSHSGAWRSM